MSDIHNKSKFLSIYFEEALRQKTTQEWLALLWNANDIACGAVVDYPRVLDDPQVRHNQMILEMGLNGEKYKTIAPMFKMPGILEGTPGTPADLGQHIETVLKEHLGYAESQVEAIQKRRRPYRN
jgi:crotonobetainyl-CoA:carnitine CoA-transferase CaiB-like acyl-CoA transferase